MILHLNGRLTGKKAWLGHEKSAWIERWAQNEGDKAMGWKKQNIKGKLKKLIPLD